MSITSNVPVPTSYRKLQEKKYLGYPYRLLAVWLLTTMSYMLFFYALWQYEIGSYYVCLVPLLAGLFFISKFASDAKTLDGTIFHLRLVWRIVTKRNMMKKYVEPLDDLKKLFPVETVEDTGLIRYTDNTSGVFVRLDPPRVSDDDLDSHNKKMRNVVNSLYGKYNFQFLAFSAEHNTDSVSDIARDAMKRKDNTAETNEHLHSIYSEAVSADTNTIEWTFLLLVCLPVTDTVEEAEKLRQAFLSGLTKELARTGILSKVVDDRTETIQIMRESITAVIM